MKMNKSIIIMITLVFIIVTGCSINGNDGKYGEIESEPEETLVHAYGILADLSLEEVINQSYCVVTASLNKISERKNSREYDFTLTDTIVGSMSEARFCVDEGYTDVSVENSDTTYSTYDTQYEVGKEYILVLYKISSVYEERDQYMIAGDIFVEIDSADNITEYQRYHKAEKSPYKSVEEFSNYVRSVTDNSKERLVYGIPFTRSTKISEIVDASQYIVKAVVNEIDINNPNDNRDTYICRVTERLRGETRDEIRIVLFKDTASIGKEYLFLLNKSTEYSLIYALSSVNSVVDVSKDKSIVDEITALTLKQ